MFSRPWVWVLSAPAAQPAQAKSKEQFFDKVEVQVAFPIAAVVLAGGAFAMWRMGMFSAVSGSAGAAAARAAGRWGPVPE